MLFLKKKKLNTINTFIKEAEFLISDILDILNDIEELDFRILFDSLLSDFYCKMNNFYYFVCKNELHYNKSCYLNFQSSTGGVESENINFVIFKAFLNMLEKNNVSYDLLDADINGDLLKNATLKINEDFSYSFFSNEKGIHRFTRVSPYGNGKLHTSFIYIDVYPCFDDIDDISINKKDIRIDTFRGSGAGGQHRNKTDSAVRITHIPTNTVVKIENERSQHANKKIAMSILISKLKAISLKDKDNLDTSGKIHNFDWGNQIRSYSVEQNRIKDHRTEKTYNIGFSNYLNDLYFFIKDNNSTIKLKNIVI